MNLFFQPQITEASKHVVFDKEESRHIVKVLRKQEDDVLFVTNGKGFIFEVVLTSVQQKQCEGNIISNQKKQPLPYQLHMAVAPTKLNDRYEWFLEKATEIGITEITPIICDHSERKIIKPERYEKILESAMKQSLSGYLPVLHKTIPFKDFITSQKEIASKFIAHCEETSPKHSLKSILKPKKSALILIGPEGDFSSSEIKMAQENGFAPITLGDRRLRTETAAIVACHSVSFINEE